MLSPRNLKRVKARPKLANTTSREIRLTPVPYFPFLEKVESELNENFTSNYDEGPQYEQQWKPVPTEQNHTGVRMVTLPRLNDADKKQNCLTTRSMDTDYIRLPEISTISKRNGRLALNRSITDLLDPEMEILNKVRAIINCNLKYYFYPR